MYRLPSLFILGILLLVPTQGFGDEAKILRLKCQLMSGMFELDPTEARKLVPVEYELALNDRGRAVSRFYVASNCQEASFNNKDILSNDFGYTEVLIDIQGPPEIPKIKGAQSNSLTRYHYKLWGQVAGAKADAFFQEIRKTDRPISKVDEITMGKLVDINTPCDINGKIVEPDGVIDVVWKEQLGPFIPGHMVGIKTKTSYNSENGKVKHTATECLVTVGQMGPLTIEAHPEKVFGKTFGKTKTGKAIEHSPSAECTIWFEAN